MVNVYSRKQTQISKFEKPWYMKIKVELCATIKSNMADFNKHGLEMTADITTMTFSEKDFYKNPLDIGPPDEQSANKLETLKFENNYTDDDYSKYAQGANMCRACLTQNDDLHQLLLPEEVSTDVKNNILIMFISCTSLELSWDDQYPKHICNKCLSELSQAYEFWKKCRQSIDKLNQQINSLKSIEKNDIAVKNIKKQRHKKQLRNSQLNNIREPEENISIEQPESLTDTVEMNNENNEVPDRIKFEVSTPEESDGRKSFRRCKKCEMVFPNKAEYAKHAKYHNKYLCPVCGYFCGSIGGLHAHAASHSNLRPYQCKVCSKQYKSQSSLQVHMRNHTGERRYTCEQCGVKFITWNSLNSHIKTHHSTARPYVCEICLKSFKQSSTLKIHKRQHTGEKPYPCTECSMAFKSSSDLKGHMVKHTGERNYPCTLCEKRFSKPYNLKQHMVTHTGERKHKCEICGRAFTQAHVLRGHMKTHREQIHITSDL